MISASRNRRTRASRRLFCAECLESRHLLSVTLPPGIASVVPADGSALTQSPQNLVITFDQQYVAYGASSADIQLYPVINGLVQTGSPIFGTATVPEPLEIPDPPGAPANGTVLQVPLQLQDLTLPGGTYQIDIAGGSGLEGALGFFSGAPWTSGNDVALAQFTVPDTGGATLSQPTANLGTIGSTVQNVWGALDSHDAGSAVDLYQINLAAGHSWELGLAVSAESIGSPLLPDLTLFDAQGNVIAFSKSGTGLSSDPIDPYLFSGLARGTYYVGVSTSTNLPYGSGGYNPVTGTQGLAGLNQTGGSFELSLLAQPHDQPTKLVSSSLDYSDDLGPSPTGLTLTFSSPLNLNNLFIPDSEETALTVVDSSGQTYPTTAEQYDVSDGKLILIFDLPLPAGTYSLIVPSQGGLTDLAGQPVTAAGQPPGVLASWTVAPRYASVDQDNLGVLWPSGSQVLSPTAANAFSQTIEIGPHQIETYRWVVTVPGYYVLQTQNSSGSLAVQNSGNSGTTVLDPHSTQGLNTYEMFLEDGVYELRFINLESRPVVVSWVLKIGLLDWEKIVDNGVGQGSALSLMAFTPAPADSATNFPSASAPASAPVSASASAPVSAPVSASASAPVSAPNDLAILQLPGSSVFGGSMGSVPLNLLVTVDTSPLGQPSSEAGLASTAGLGGTGMVAVADRTPGIFPGFRPGAMLATIQGTGEADPSVDLGLPAAKVVLIDKAMRTSSAVNGLGGGLEAERARADLSALAADDWLVRLVSSVKSNLVRLAGGSKLVPPAEFSGAPAMTSDESDSRPREPIDRDRTRRSNSTVQADLGSVATLIVATAVARRLWRPIREKWRGRHPSVVAAQRPARPFCRAPHVLAGARSRSRHRTARLLHH
jgi:Bacterial pre-peptidase C-terminal domain